MPAKKISLEEVLSVREEYLEDITYNSPYSKSIDQGTGWEEIKTHIEEALNVYHESSTEKLSENSSPDMNSLHKQLAHLVYLSKLLLCSSNVISAIPLKANSFFNQDISLYLISSSL